MERMAAAGMKLTEIAEALGVNYNTLQMYRREFGLPPLSKGRIRGSRHGRWKGGRSVEKRSGYVRVYNGRVYVYEHTLIAEKMLGRPLVQNEVVHHLNGDPADNRPENLRVLSRSEHKLYHLQLEAIGLALLRSGHVRITDSGYELDPDALR